jgi:hypothetical protein
MDYFCKAEVWPCAGTEGGDAVRQTDVFHGVWRVLNYRWAAFNLPIGQAALAGWLGSEMFVCSRGK